MIDFQSGVPGMRTNRRTEVYLVAFRVKVMSKLSMGAPPGGRAIEAFEQSSVLNDPQATQA